MNYEKKIAELEARIARLEALPEAAAARAREAASAMMTAHHLKVKEEHAAERARLGREAIERAKAFAVLELPKATDVTRRMTCQVPTLDGGLAIMENPGESFLIMPRVELDRWRDKSSTLAGYLANGTLIMRDLTPDEAHAHMR